MSIENSTIPHNKPLTLTGYPACEDCLAWSDEGLAIAVAGNVHVVELAANHNQQPSTVVLRADLFTHEEWPEKPLATLRHLSIGEESSLSVVVALKWSPPGLGIHQRPVLTVLTSNLLLSIWETDGSPRNWQRTCIVNHHLPSPSNPSHPDNDHSRSDHARPSSRIRSYAWSDPLNTSGGGKWGLQFLAVLDDQEHVTIFQTSKSSKDLYGTWSLVQILTFALPHLQLSDHIDLAAAAATTELQQALIWKASVKDMKFLAWTVDTSSATSLNSKAQTALTYQRHHQSACFRAPLEFNVFLSSSIATAKNLLDESHLDGKVPSSPASLQRGLGVVHSLDDRPQWRATLKDIVADFDRINRLDGIYRIRFWGFASSPQRDMEATCVTLHPWDMHEYTSTVLEKCRIVFRPLRGPLMTAHRPQRSLEAVLYDVLEFVLHCLETYADPLTSLDLRLLRVLHAWAVMMNRGNDNKASLLGARIEQTAHHSQNPQLTEHAQTAAGKFLCAEFCDICDAPINQEMKSNASACANGHVFSRCNLSLISIQEPKISKYCSRCKRQFLNLSKLKPSPGQCLTTKLYHEFDVCPYCQARFRS